MNGQIKLQDVELTKKYIADHRIKTWLLYDSGEIKSITFVDNSTTRYNLNGTIQSHSYRKKEWEVKLLSSTESARLGYKSLSDNPIAQVVMPARDKYVYNKSDSLVKIVRLCPSKIHGDSTILRIGSKESISMHQPLNNITSGRSYYKTTAHLDTINIYGGPNGIGVDKDEFIISNSSAANVNLSLELFNFSEKNINFRFAIKPEGILSNIEDFEIKSYESRLIEFSVTLSSEHRQYIATIVTELIEIPIVIRHLP